MIIWEFIWVVSSRKVCSVSGVNTMPFCILSNNCESTSWNSQNPKKNLCNRASVISAKLIGFTFATATISVYSLALSWMSEWTVTEIGGDSKTVYCSCYCYSDSDKDFKITPCFLGSATICFFSFWFIWKRHIRKGKAVAKCDLYSAYRQ